MSRLIDLKNKQMGNWKVLYRCGTALDKKALWMCECMCGLKREILGTSLRKGSRKNLLRGCGCVDEFSSENMIGKTFGRWRVLSEAPRDIHGLLQFNCECSCGTVQIVRKKPLVSGKSLGCRKCCWNIKRKRPYENVYNILVSVARKRGQEVLSYEAFIKVIQNGSALCFYCEAKILWTKFVHSLTGRKMNYSLDRKDNTKGYPEDNVVPCCKECNYMKSDRYTFEEMLLLKPALIKIREAREIGVRK